jgi:hypothetical protein
MPGRIAVLSLVLSVACWLMPADAAMTDQDKAELATAVSGAKVTLEQGLKASQTDGKPVSAKFEIAGGKPQLSVYTVQDATKYFEVIVDHSSGTVAKVDPITGGDDLTAAKEQSAGLFRATRDLREAVREAKHDNPGYLAVSAWPEMKDGHSMANVVLFKDGDWRTVVIDLTVYRVPLKD